MICVVLLGTIVLQLRNYYLEDLAQMRTKGAMVSRLEETRAGQRSLIKTLNIAGLPFLVVVVGVIVWLGRSARGRRIREAFMQDGEQKE